MNIKWIDATYFYRTEDEADALIKVFLKPLEGGNFELDICCGNILIGDFFHVGDIQRTQIDQYVKRAYENPRTSPDKTVRFAGAFTACPDLFQK
jgi:hypothetical protein